jgi:hypothetical protein
MEMKKKYEKPAMRVYVLKQRSGLLVGSPVESRSSRSSLNDYTTHDYDEE